MWTHTWTTGKVLFILARYLPMLQIVSSIICRYPSNTLDGASGLTTDIQ